MINPLKDPLPGCGAPVLRPDVLACIHSSNDDYLQLLAAESVAGARATQLQHFSPKLQRSIAELPKTARQALACVPYALYSLGFEDVRFWESACEPTAMALDARYAADISAGLQESFLEVAMIQAWQSAISHGLAARVMYSMSEPVRERLSATPLWKIKRVANDCAGLLMPRWPTNPSFWPDLIRFANERDAVRLRTAKLLGIQLTAGELIAVSKSGYSSGPYGGAGRAPVTRRVRLRSR
jgi:hypothetical protein